MTKSFADLKLSPESLHALDRAGFEHPTPIQAQAIPPALAGRDVIGTAATGTGKTAAFLLPIIDRLAGEAGGTPAPRLVLAPTRELALQIGEELERFGGSRRVRGAVVIGGVGMGAQTEALRHRADVVIATPGRLVDHLQQRHRQARRASRCSSSTRPTGCSTWGSSPSSTGSSRASRRSGRRCSSPRRWAARSRTSPAPTSSEPVRVEVARSGTTAARAEQQVFLAEQHEKLALLLALLERDDVTTLVFTRTKRRADRVWKGIGRAGHKVARIHADRSQAQRRMALDGFKDGTYRVLVATDIAARGIDVAEIGHVVNFDLPHVPEDYVHRVGRTARAEASGRASSFTSPEEKDLLVAIEKLVRAAIPRADVPRDTESFKAEVKRSGGGARLRLVPAPGAARPARRPPAAGAPLVGRRTRAPRRRPRERRPRLGREVGRGGRRQREAA